MDMESPQEQFDNLSYQVMVTGQFQSLDSVVPVIDSITTAEVQSVSVSTFYVFKSFNSVLPLLPF